MFFCFLCVSKLHIFFFSIILGPTFSLNANPIDLGCKCGNKEGERIVGGGDADVSNQFVILLVSNLDQWVAVDCVDAFPYTPACMANTGDDFMGKSAWLYGKIILFGAEMGSRNFLYLNLQVLFLSSEWAWTYK